MENSQLKSKSHRIYISFRQNEDIDSNELPSQQDYALFMRFEIVGSKDGFLQSHADIKMSNIGGYHTLKQERCIHIRSLV